MIVDAHQHYWKISRGERVFPAPSDELLHRDFLPSCLLKHTASAGVGATIAVQANQTIGETEFLLSLAESNTTLAGVVGWCDLSTGHAACQQMETLMLKGPLLGLRPMLQSSDNADWLLQEDARISLAWMAKRNLSLDALVDVRHLAIIQQVAEQHPDLQIIINHFAKPWRHISRIDEWQDLMAGLAAAPNCWVKISGFPFAEVIKEAQLQLEYLLDFLMTHYGSRKLIWGSDWPVALRQTNYSDAMNTVRKLLKPDIENAVFQSNARVAYKLADWDRLETLMARGDYETATGESSDP